VLDIGCDAGLTTRAPAGVMRRDHEPVVKPAIRRFKSVSQILISNARE
jgi:hypothetical protein